MKNTGRLHSRSAVAGTPIDQTGLPLDVVVVVVVVVMTSNTNNTNNNRNVNGSESSVSSGGSQTVAPISDSIEATASTVSTARVADESEKESSESSLPKSGLSTKDVGKIGRKRVGKLNPLCDVILESQDGQRTPAKRAKLAACSQYFRSALEKLSLDPNTVLRIPDVPGVMLQQIVQFSRSKDIGDKSWSNINQLLVWADTLKVPSLTTLLYQLLINQLDKNNCVFLVRMMRTRQSPEMAEKARMFLLKNFDEVAITNNDILEYSLDELTELLDSQQLNVANERSVWQLIERWISRDQVQRLQYTECLLKRVRLCMMDGPGLDAVRSSPFIQVSEASRTLVGNAYKFRYNLPLFGRDVVDIIENKTCTARYPNRLLLAVGGWSNAGPTPAFEAYDGRIGVWNKLEYPDPNGPRAYHGCAVQNSEMWIVGGLSGHTYFNSLRRFDFLTKLWIEQAPMQSRRCYVSVAFYQQKLWAISGYDGTNRISSVESYDVTTNRWTFTAPLSLPRSDSHAAVCSDRIYIPGGFDGNDCLNSVEYYDPSANRWTTVTSLMKHRRSALGCVAINNALYVVGGFNGISRQNSAERYDPREGRWILVEPMSTRRSNFGVEVIDGKIVVIGGFNGLATTNHCEMYEPRANSWLPMPSMNVNRSALYCCVVEWLPNMCDYVSSYRMFPTSSRVDARTLTWN